MPELPDVEIFKRYLDATALHQKIIRVPVENRRIVRHTSPQALARNLDGRELQSTRRHGKFLFGRLDKNGSVIFHFGMTGFLKYFENKAEEPEHTRVWMQFSSGSFLSFVCPRMFGEVDYTRDVDQYIAERDLGPDALAVTRKQVKDRLAGKSTSVKSALMNQQVLAGIGNVYSDEVLFQARVHPQERLEGLDARNLEWIYVKMKSVLKQAIRHQADLRLLPKSWLLTHREEAPPCPQCGTKLRRIPIMQRSSYVCPRCQRKSK